MMGMGNCRRPAVGIKLAWCGGSNYLEAPLRTLAFLASLLAVGSLAGPASAQEGHHGVGHAELHEAYRGLMRPDAPGSSCCNDQDCRPTRARFNNATGNWEAVKDGRWITIPWSKVVDADVPSQLGAQAHLCAPPPSWTWYGPDEVFCFVRPNGGM
jgi:hypothetical protein